MKVPMKVPMKAPMRQSMRVGSALGRNYTVLDGLTNYISVPVYTPTSANTEIPISVQFDPASMGSQVVIIADQDGGSERLIKNASDQIVFGYKDVDGLDQTVTVATPVVADTAYNLNIVTSGLGVELFVDVLSASNSAVIDPADLEIVILGANSAGTSEFLGGRLWNFAPTEKSEIQGGDYLRGNGTDIRIVIPAGFVMNQGDTFEFWTEVAPSGGFGYFVQWEGSHAFYIRLTNSNTFEIVGADINFKIDGRAETNSSFAGVTGQNYHVTGYLQRAAVASEPKTLYAPPGAFGFSASVMGGVIFTKANGDTLIYRLDDLIDNGDGTATAPNSGNTGSAFDATVQNFAPSDLEAIANNSRNCPIDEPDTTNNVTDELGDGSTDGTVIGTRTVEQG